MTRSLCVLLGLLSILWVPGQTLIRGTVATASGKPIPFANVFIEGIYDGGTTDEQGAFSFMTEAEGGQVLVVRRMNYKPLVQQIYLAAEDVSLTLVLLAAPKALNAVVISAGAFEASDEKQGTVLKPLDIVQNAGAAGDVYGALQTLPGVSQVGDETGIFVRGGEAYETQTLIDGTLVQRPFFSNVPNIPSRGRFDPFLFKGILFTTGGYSAEYGRALSSVLLLETQDLPRTNSSSLSMNLAGLDVAHSHVWNKRTSLVGSIGYTNLRVLFGIVPQNVDWSQPPSGIGSNWAFRHKTRKGLFKSNLQIQHGGIGLRFPNLDQPGIIQDFSNQNTNTYWNSSYEGLLGEKWSVRAAFSLDYDQDGYQLAPNTFGTNGLLAQGRLTLSRGIGKHVLWKVGSEVHRTGESHYFNRFETPVREWYAAGYSEAEASLGKHVALRAGVRAEYSDLLQEATLAPRASVAIRVGKNGQASLAYGQFYQRPQSEFLWQVVGVPGADLRHEMATHYIANYQWMKDGRILRIEGYRKEYDRLIRQHPTTLYDNGGAGYAQGIDLFWRDNQTLTNLDYWVSYSYIQAARLYRDFPVEAQPGFITPHTLNVVANYQVGSSRFRVGSIYTYSSGRAYDDPRSEAFMEERTPVFHNLNMNLSCLTSIWGRFAVLYFSVRNPFGFEQIFGYRYAADGLTRTPIVPAATRSFFAGMFVSF